MGQLKKLQMNMETEFGDLIELTAGVLPNDPSQHNSGVVVSVHVDGEVSREVFLNDEDFSTFRNMVEVFATAFGMMDRN